MPGYAGQIGWLSGKCLLSCLRGGFLNVCHDYTTRITTDIQGGVGWMKHHVHFIIRQIEHNFTLVFVYSVLYNPRNRIKNFLHQTRVLL